MTDSAIRTGPRTRGTPDGCEYQACGEPGVGEARWVTASHYRPWTMCEDHLNPDSQPEEMRDKDTLVRWQ